MRFKIPFESSSCWKWPRVNERATTLALAHAHICKHSLKIFNIFQRALEYFTFVTLLISKCALTQRKFYWGLFNFLVTACVATTKSKLPLFRVRSSLYFSLCIHTAHQHIQETSQLFSHRGFNLWVLKFQKSRIPSCLDSIQQSGLASFSSTVHIWFTHSSKLTAHRSYALHILATSKFFD